MALAVHGCLCAALLGCGGSRPPVVDTEPLPATERKEKDNGAGNLTFHYANKSTDANMQLDLSSTDVYLEMSGKPMGADQPPDPAPRAARPDASERTAQARPEPAPQESPAKPPQRDPQERPKPDRPKQGDSGDAQPPEEEEDKETYYDGDATSKVLAGIRRAQELFYQKRYPEALQMVRQSLAIQPTAEGHALAGSIHYMMGKNGLARRNWQEALRLNPDLPSVVRMLEKTSTPGGRGSPFPRPVMSRSAPRPYGGRPAQSAAERAPFPDVQEEESSMPNDNAPEPPPAPRALPPRPAPVPEAAPPAEAGSESSGGTGATDAGHEPAAVTAPVPAKPGEPAKPSAEAAKDRKPAPAKPDPKAPPETKAKPAAGKPSKFEKDAPPKGKQP